MGCEADSLSRQSALLLPYEDLRSSSFYVGRLRSTGRSSGEFVSLGFMSFLVGGKGEGAGQGDGGKAFRFEDLRPDILSYGLSYANI